MNRKKFQQLSEERIKDAEALLAADRWSGAYYLAGYALECALKSCVIAYVGREADIIFKEKRFSENCWTHNLETLVKQADLKTERDTAIEKNKEFGKNWLVAKDWSEATRYKSSTQQQAKDLIEAITDNSDGVLQWVKNHW